MTMLPNGNLASTRLLEEHRDRARNAANRGEPYLVPAELATILAVGGEVAIEETAIAWLGTLENLGHQAGSQPFVDRVRRVSDMFACEDVIRNALSALVRAQPAKPAMVSEWVDLELGQRVQVLAVLVHLLVPPLD